MHPSQTLVPRLSNLIARGARRTPVRFMPPAGVVAVHHVETHAPRGFFGRLQRRGPRQLPAPMIAWNDHLSMV